MLYYNIKKDQPARPALKDKPMATHHHRHHALGHAHPPASVLPSILRLSAAERVTGAALLIAVLWALVFWAMG